MERSMRGRSDRWTIFMVKLTPPKTEVVDRAALVGDTDTSPRGRCRITTVLGAKQHNQLLSDNLFVRRQSERRRQMIRTVVTIPAKHARVRSILILRRGHRSCYCFYSAASSG